MEFCTFPVGAQWNKWQTGLFLMTSSEQLKRFRRFRRTGNLNCAAPCAPPCCDRRAGGVEAVGVWLGVRDPQVGLSTAHPPFMRTIDGAGGSANRTQAPPSVLAEGDGRSPPTGREEELHNSAGPHKSPAPRYGMKAQW